MKKRIIALIFAFTLTAGIMPLDVYAADSPSKWAAEIVNVAIEGNLVPQSLQSNYTQALKRAEFCALAVTLYEKVTGREITERATFDDTKDVNVEKAAALGVVIGMGNKLFMPDDKLTREQAATMLVRLADLVGSPLSGYELNHKYFSDEASISDWAVESVNMVQEASIMVGVGGDKFAPKAPYTREQGIITIMRLYSDSHGNFYAGTKSIIDFVQEFGALLKEVDLMTPEIAPGRAGSSPWPDRIEVSGLEKLSRNEFVINGTVIWITSTEIESGGAVFTQSIVLNVRKDEASWIISDIVIK